MRAPHFLLWADPRLAEAYDHVADVARDYCTAEDVLSEFTAVLDGLLKADELLASILRERKAA